MSDPVWSANCKQSLLVMLPVALIFKIYYYAGIVFNGFVNPLCFNGGMIQIMIWVVEFLESLWKRPV